MSLNLKIILVLSALLVAIVVIVVGLQRLVILPSFTDLESHAAEADVDRCVNAIERELARIDLTCHDWAAWDDMYEAALGPSEEFVATSMQTSTFAIQGVEIGQIVAPDGRVVWQIGVDLESGRVIAIDGLPTVRYPPDHALISHGSSVRPMSERTVRGVVMVGRRPLLVVSRPIVTTEHQGPIRGSLIFGHFLSAEDLARFREQVRVEVSVEPVVELPPPLLRALVSANRPGGAAAVLDRVDSRRLEARRLMRDIEGEPAIAVTAHIPREITHRGRSALRDEGLMALGLAMVLVMALVLRRVVLTPLSALERHTRSICSTRDYTRPSRLGEVRRDEIGSLAASFDELLAVITSDISHREQAAKQRRELEEQLRQSQKLEAIGQLAAGVAHDFNNLLTGITLSVDTLLATWPEDAAVREELLTIRGAVRQAATVTAQLLATGRKQLIEPKVIDLNDLLASSCAMIQRVIGERTGLVFLPGESLGCIKVDPNQMDQVFMNLAVNARDAMPSGGTLVVRTEAVDLSADDHRTRIGFEPGRYVRWTVSDSGTGMTPEVKARIFEPFFTTKEKGRGTGLGLSTTYGIVSQSGGFIEVDSEVGEGTTFSILLPVTTEERSSQPETARALPATGHEHILLVDDEMLVMRGTRRVLERHGYTVTAATDGLQALALFDQGGQDIHLLLTDVVMPGLNGKELHERLRALKPELRVLYMSGYNEDVITSHGVLSDDTAFIQKPFSVEELVSRVRSTLDGGPSEP
jgi:signal transduction histidine kinase/ActR/RegA family two-component response regulator